MQFPMTLELLTCLSAKIFWAMPKLVKNLKALKEIFIIQREERERLLKDFVSTKLLLKRTVMRNRCVSFNIRSKEREDKRQNEP